MSAVRLAQNRAARERGLEGLRPRHCPLVIVAVICVLGGWCWTQALLLAAPIWSPRDEIAHYDYIDRLTSGELPHPRDRISRYTFFISQELEWSRPSTFDGSIRSMGIAGRSYEAQQPPLYYALLALVNYSLRSRVTPPTQILALRTITLSFYFVGAVVVLIAGAKRQDSRILVAACVASCAMAFLGTGPYITLGNDSLSVLLGSMLFLFAFDYNAAHKTSSLIGMASVVAAAILTKQTNVSLLVVPCALAVLDRYTERRQSPLVWLSVVAPAVVVIGALALTNVWRTGGALGSYSADRYFSSWVTPPDSLFSFFVTLAATALRPAPSEDVSGGWFVAAALGFLLAAVALLGEKRAKKTLIQFEMTRDLVVAAAVVAATLIGASLMHQYQPGVHWHQYRHYAAAAPFLFFIFCFPVGLVLGRLSKSIGRVRNLCA
jgi:hypothetical protein